MNPSDPSDNAQEGECAVDGLLRSDDMADDGVHVLQWRADHWRCGCGREFANSDVDIAAFDSHAPDAKALVVMTSHTDEDVRLADHPRIDYSYTQACGISVVEFAAFPEGHRGFYPSPSRHVGI